MRNSRWLGQKLKVAIVTVILLHGAALRPWISPTWAEGNARTSFFATLAIDGVERRVSGSNAAGVVAELTSTLTKQIRDGAEVSSVVITLGAGRWHLPDGWEVSGWGRGEVKASLTIRGQGPSHTILDGLLATTPTVKRDAFSGMPMLSFPAAPAGCRSAPFLPATALGAELDLSPARLVRDHQPLALARWPRDGYLDGEISYANDGTATLKLATPAGAIAGTTTLWAHGFFTAPWADEHVPVAVAGSGRTASLIKTPKDFGKTRHARLYFENVDTALRPGANYVIDPQEQRLISLAPEAAQADGYAVVCATNVMRISGSARVVLADLGLEFSRQAALVFHNTDDVLARNIAVRHAGGYGVQISGTRSKLRDCTIRETGYGGAFVAGGSREPMLIASNEVHGCQIERTGRWRRTYSPAIWLYGVGNAARDNTITRLPHAGIIFSGDMHAIERNHIANTGLESSDVGAIYSEMDPTMRGNVVVANTICNVAMPDRIGVGVYLDGMSSGTTVSANDIIGAQIGVLVGGGLDNSILGNRITAWQDAIRIDARQLGWARNQLALGVPGGAAARLAALPPSDSAWRKRFPRLDMLADELPLGPARNTLRSNLVRSGALNIDVRVRSRQTVADMRSSTTDNTLDQANHRLEPVPACNSHS